MKTIFITADELRIGDRVKVGMSWLTVSKVTKKWYHRSIRMVCKTVFFKDAAPWDVSKMRYPVETQLEVRRNVTD